MKKCPYCAEEIQDEAIVCRYCGRDLVPVSLPKTQPRLPRVNVTNYPTPDQKKAINKKNIVVISIIIAIAVFCVAFVIIYNLRSKSSSAASIGDTVSLYYGGVEILCGRTEQNYKDLIAALDAKDDYGFQEMFISGRAFKVNSGTKALVLDMHLTAAEVRIMDGAYQNNVAWVAIEAISK